MRLYVHTQTHTWIFKGTGEEKVQFVLSEFVRAASTFTGLKDASVLKASLPNGKQIAGTDALSRHFSDRDDLHVAVAVASTPALQPVAKAAAKAPEPAKASASGSGSARITASDLESSLKVVTELLGKAKIAVTNKNYAQARVVYTEILKVVPHDSPEGVACLDKLAYIAEDLRQWDTASELLAKVHASLKPPHSDDPALLLRLGSALRQKGDFPGSIEAYEKALKLVRSGRAASSSSSAAAPGAPPGPPVTINRIKVLMAEPLYLIGARDPAVSLIMTVIGEEPNLPEALLQYSKIAIDRGLWQDAIRSLLRLLAAQPNGREGKRLLAQCLQEPGGLNLLRKELPTKAAPEQALALGFVATSVKEHGAVAEAAEILGDVSESLPDSPGHALAHAHALETCGRPLEALRALGAFFARAAAKGARVGPVAVSEFAGLAALPANLAAAEAKQRRSRATWDGRALPADLTDAEAAQFPQAAAASPAGGAAVQQREFPPEELDLLACVCTTVKLLYSFGLFRRAAALASFADAAKAASKAELHTTHIRNEHAFFLFLSAVLRRFPVGAEEQALAAPAAAGGDAASEPVYLVGDSHCLAAAWRGAELPGGGKGWFAPLLVTGCKAWHLRPECSFYTRVNFFSAVGRVPKNSKVVMLFGEIDCREGLLISVQKGRYNDIAEAIDSTVKIYLSCLLKLIEEHNYDIYVHPVPPVLDVTRAVVVPYTERLKSATLEAAATPAAKGRLHFLDFFDALLTGAPADGDKRSLRAEYVLDGTHLAPTYVAEINRALGSLGGGAATK